MRSLYDRDALESDRRHHACQRFAFRTPTRWNLTFNPQDAISFSIMSLHRSLDRLVVRVPYCRHGYRYLGTTRTVLVGHRRAPPALVRHASPRYFFAGVAVCMAGHVTKRVDVGVLEANPLYTDYLFLIPLRQRRL